MLANRSGLKSERFFVDQNPNKYSLISVGQFFLFSQKNSPAYRKVEIESQIDGKAEWSKLKDRSLNGKMFIFGIVGGHKSETIRLLHVHSTLEFISCDFNVHIVAGPDLGVVKIVVQSWKIEANGCLQSMAWMALTVDGIGNAHAFAAHENDRHSQ